MPCPAPFFREAGNGPNVVCLHSSAASSAQWRPLMDQLCDKYRVLAVDLYGEGMSPPWTSGRDCTIDDELELLNPLLDERAPFTLVGHSYGGAVAVRIALAKRQSVQALVLYEPALWGLLATVDPDDEGTKEIEAVRQSLIEQLGLGNDEAATQGFIDYWAGVGTWASVPEDRRPLLIQGAKANAKKWRESLGYPFLRGRDPGASLARALVDGVKFDARCRQRSHPPPGVASTSGGCGPARPRPSRSADPSYGC